MKKSKLVKVTFEPDGTEVFVPAGTLLSKAAAAAGHAGRNAVRRRGHVREVPGDCVAAM